MKHERFDFTEEEWRRLCIDLPRALAPELAHLDAETRCRLGHGRNVFSAGSENLTPAQREYAIEWTLRIVAWTVEDAAAQAPSISTAPLRERWAGVILEVIADLHAMGRASHLEVTPFLRPRRLH
jgi:hypothetical protein